MDIERIFYGITTVATLTFAVLTLQRLLSGWWRSYYLLVLILVLVIAAVVPPAASYVSLGNWSLVSAQRLYWTQALIYQVLILALVLQLIHRVGHALPNTGALIRTLTIGALTVSALSAFAHSGLRINSFMTAVTRDLTFLSAVLNLVLWKLLLQWKKRDFLLLAVSAGLGLQCTGDAIGHSLRILGKQAAGPSAIHDFGNVLMSLSAVLTVAIWHTAFSRSRYKQSVSSNSSPAVTTPAL